MNKEINDYIEEISLWNIHSIFIYIKEHIVSFLLLLLVIIIIYIVDHISNINAIIFTLPSPVIGLPNHNKSQIQMHNKLKISKKHRTSKI